MINSNLEPRSSKATNRAAYCGNRLIQPDLTRSNTLLKNSEFKSNNNTQTVRSENRFERTVRSHVR